MESIRTHRYFCIRSLRIIVLLEICLVFTGMSGQSIVVSEPMDLKGKTISIPHAYKLVFKKDGRLMNGTIVGDYTAVIGQRKVIFQNVKLEGSFVAKEAYSDWFDIKADCILDSTKKYVLGTDNYQNFKNLFLFPIIEIKSGVYMISGMLNCISNQKVNGNGAVIKCLNQGVSINVDSSRDKPIEHVEINNLHLIGQKLEFSTPTQWWHGVNIAFARDVRIENVLSEFFRGDGFYIGTNIGVKEAGRIPTNITILNCKSYNNFRQGLSITRANGVKIIGSEFSYTSGQSPEAGIDIEVNMVKTKEGKTIVGECENIEIRGCLFRNNKRHGFIISNAYYSNISVNSINNVKLYDCKFEDDDISIMGCDNCKLENLEITGGHINISGGSIIRNLTLSSIKMVENQPSSNKDAISLNYKPDWPERNDILIDNVYIKGYGGRAIYVGYDRRFHDKIFNNVSITNCVIEECGGGILLLRNSINGLVEKNIIIK